MYPWFEQTYKQLVGRISSSQLHHGLLFLADEGAGEQSLILALAKALVCENKNACNACKGCSLFEAQSHPDVQIVVSDKPSIGVDLIRKVSEFVTTTAQLMGNKVIIIHGIDAMTEAASNSLLKTLEEPSKNTFLILSTTQPNNLLPTIKSRCEKIRLRLPSEEQSLAWLRSNTNETTTSEGLYAYSGSPITYLQALNDKAANFHEFIGDIANLQENKVFAESVAKKWKAEPSLALKWAYQWSILEYKKCLQQGANLSKLDELQNISDLCSSLKPKLEQAGINFQLILQRVFSQISDFRSV